MTAEGGFIGWIEVEEMRSVEHARVYDEPRGTHIGYTSAFAGYVPKELFEQPGFDLEAYEREQIGDAEYDALRGLAERTDDGK